VCRNERLCLPAFLNHYRSLGVEEFLVIDNDSSDGSPEYLATQPDVRVFRTSDRFGEATQGTDWLNALLAEFGVGFWCVTVDIDELLVYLAPSMLGHEGRPLAELPGLTALHQRIALEFVEAKKIGPDLRVRARPIEGSHVHRDH